MNMKKTIAAIAAGAMAVSAMASSVSAIELADKVLSYNLVRTVLSEQKGTVTVTGSVSLALTASESLAVYVAVPAGMAVKSITISGFYDGNSATPIQPITRVDSNAADNYGATVANGYLIIPIDTSASSWLHADGGTNPSTVNISAVIEHKVTKQKDMNVDEVGAGRIAILARAAAGITAPAYVATAWIDSNSNDIKDVENYNYVWTTKPTTIDANTLEASSDGVNDTNPTQLNDIVTSAFTAYNPEGNKDLLPFTTGPNNNMNVAYYLQNFNVRDDKHSYSNVLPTINDAIANYGTVTFTFHTAAQPIAWKFADANGNLDTEAFGPTKSSWGNEYIDRDWDGRLDGLKVDGYNTALYAAYNDPSRVYAVYAEDWYGDTSYMSFTEHLYNGTRSAYGPEYDYTYYTNGYDGTRYGWYGFENESSGYYGGLWGDNNLFGGALVINENLTMRLSDVDMSTTYAPKKYAKKYAVNMTA